MQISFYYLFDQINEKRCKNYSQNEPADHVSPQRIVVGVENDLRIRCQCHDSDQYG